MINNRPLRIAILGSGPSGFFAADELLSNAGRPIELDMFDALPTPFGLVRGGVAPDHQKIKSVMRVYDKTAAKPGFRFLGNVSYDKDLKLEDLRKHYDAAIFATGAKSDVHLGVPGEDLKGSAPATAFVGWYNGHPDYREEVFDLSCERAVVIGNGNVAMDVTRILASDPEEIADTDIAEHALEALRASKIQEIYLIGRRGPLQAAFTNPEIRELCELKGAELIIHPDELKLEEETLKDVALGKISLTAKNNHEILKQQSIKPAGERGKKIIVKFLMSPVEILGEDGQVKAVKFEKNKLVRSESGTLRPKGTGEFETIECGLILRSVGYKGVALPEIPYDEKSGIIPNDKGRVLEPGTKTPIPGLYVVGWAKRGPSGVIGTNKPDSIETVKELLKDFSAKELSDDADKKPEAVLETLKSKEARVVTYADWRKIDAMEVARGKLKGKPREKFTSVAEMLTALAETWKAKA